MPPTAPYCRRWALHDIHRDGQQTGPVQRLLTFVVLVMAVTSCSSETTGSAKEPVDKSCAALPTSGPKPPRPLLAEPNEVKAGDPVNVRLAQGQVSPEAVSLYSAFPPCRKFDLVDGNLIEARDGDVRHAYLSFANDVVFDTPFDAETGDYTVCTVTPVGTASVDACGSLVIS